ncbi:uncharacterized protein TRAVEDRAFT_51560 [Trametes versicolor FP-101664 SS1]|uniref:uncharacterized protein n=1 Tax=Trametes versicolor (strain FP-101664) TaxID=717944 RepID=UPI0004621390|nr:uncharacterized protein TRAVEDRAFT_51560 [Trametes versicolor FP-101664 SS1]EIW53817.1 hypothetical protein TRAVEDRAFT_51560 [Trametes versicolor FP-101664 SS1]
MRSRPPHTGLQLPTLAICANIRPARTLVPPTSTRLSLLGLHQLQIRVPYLLPQSLDAEHGGIPSALSAYDAGPLFSPYTRPWGLSESSAVWAEMSLA